ncbi:hypothetical protein FRC08_001379 [Ceratobasidium sp. 394]|nr:hypothetical protein FRC08_001379 [Ceratobasidium sp. 394]
MTIAVLDAFSPPPSDGSLALSALADYNMENNPEHDFAVLVDPPENGGGSPIHVNYRHLGLAVHRVAHLVNPQAALPQGTKVAILTSADTVVNIALVLGIMRAGLVPFPISPRASVAGICHLLAHTGTHHVVAGGGSAISHLLDAVLSGAKQSRHCLHTIPLPSFKELFPETTEPHLKHVHEAFPCVEPASGSSVVAILHSSGSTGLPRAVPYSQAGILSNFVNQPPCWEMGEPGARVGLMALPTFHVMGYMTQCFFPQFAGYTSVLFAPASTPVVPSPAVTLQTIVNSRCGFLLTVPAFLEAWSSDLHAIKILRDLRGVVYAGGPLTPWIGDSLVKQGVSIRAAYGSTELGAPVIFELARRAPEDWVYVEFPDYTRFELIPQNDEEGTFELVMMCTPRHVPFVINYHANGEAGYATKDLVLPHPTKRRLLKFVGRVDDQIVLANGEKTNPVPMEAEIIKCPLVRAAVMFGRERNQTGVLIELEGSNLENMVDQVWPFIETANRDASTHSRIAKEAIVFSNSERPLPRTPKGNVARAASLEMYKEEISAMYSQLASCLPPSEAFTAWRDYDATESWLVSLVEDLLHREPHVYDDLFQQGLDSLTAALLLGRVKGAMLASSDSEVRSASGSVTQRTIFAQPTIHQLASYLLGLLVGDSDIEGSSSIGCSTGTISTMDTMVEKYTEGLQFNARNPSDVDSLPLENVVLTGTTGALGSHILALILGDDNVKRVWALNRAPKAGAPSTIQRQCHSFAEKMLDTRLLDHPKLTMLEADLLEGKLGLSQECYDDIQNSATTIIHNAWQVDFNLNLQSFEPSIHGTRNLLDLASKRAPRFVFTSSMSSVGLGLPGQVYPEEYTKDPSAPTGFGYGESKHVAEKLLEVARSAGLQACVVRLGQLTGDSVSGAWSKTDWVPSLVASSLAIGHLPDAMGTVAWIPLDAAAKTLLDVCQVPLKDFPPIVHVVHPRPVQWSNIMRAFAQAAKAHFGQELSFQPLGKWNQMVAQAASSCDPISARQRFPSTAIQATFDIISQADALTRELYGVLPVEVEALGVPCLQTSVCASLSPTLNSVLILGDDYVARWMSYWENVGLFVKK